ncbi:MAG: hypothetical protein ACR2P6_10295, partial [Gammaproteobacteria bacterium]
MKRSLAFVLVLAAGNLQAASLDSYLIVGHQINDSTVDVSNYELGNVSSLPGSAPAVTPPGVSPTLSPPPGYDGNVAITDPNGQVKLSDVEIYAGIGIDCQGSYNTCTDNGSNISNVDYDDAAGGAGLRSISNGDGINANVNLTNVLDQLDLAAGIVSGLSTTGSIATSSG